MKFEELTLIENQVFTQLLLEEFKRQKREGVKEYLIDKYQIEVRTQEELKKILQGT